MKPKSLQDLVPEYIERVPVAKYTFLFNRFWYYSSNDDTTLFYVELPPYGRPTYSFSRKEWGYVD
jgi:hypothetical protein